MEQIEWKWPVVHNHMVCPYVANFDRLTSLSFEDREKIREIYLRFNFRFLLHIAILCLDGKKFAFHSNHVKVSNETIKY